eukprot:SAG31_NODE_120_length_23892_cov_10.545623_10_plen_192_part_00
MLVARRSGQVPDRDKLGTECKSLQGSQRNSSTPGRNVLANQTATLASCHPTEQPRCSRFHRGCEGRSARGARGQKVARATATGTPRTSRLNGPAGPVQQLPRTVVKLGQAAAAAARGVTPAAAPLTTVAAGPGPAARRRQAGPERSTPNRILWVHACTWYRPTVLSRILVRPRRRSRPVLNKKFLWYFRHY